jgi:hypothetical protein
MIQIFVSRPTWLPTEFQQGLSEFLGLLETMDLAPRTLGVSDYPAKGPLDEVIDLLDQCAGMIVLGYPQITLATGSIKGSAVAGLDLATEWNHIEASLAYARRLPLLVIHHLSIKRGIFDRGTINSFIYEKDLARSGWALAPDVRGALAKWKSQLAVASPVLPASRAGDLGHSGMPR